MDHNQLRDHIQNFSLDNCPLGNQGYNRVLLQLFGLQGHGKSALINSLKHVLSNGKYIMHAEAGEKHDGGGLTGERRAYQLTPTITIVDNRGFTYMNDTEMRMIYAQLSNFLPLNEKVEWEGGYEDFMYKLEDAEMDPNYTDFIVPVFVYKVLRLFPQMEILQMQTFFKACRDLTGVFPIVVLTHKSSVTNSEIDKISDHFKDLGAEVIVAVENYSNEDQNKTLGRNTVFLDFLKSALDNVTFQMEERRNPREERITRKKFLLKYAYEIAVAKEVKEAKKKQEQETKERSGNKDKDSICNIL